MQIKAKIKGNEELYGDDIDLIPLNLEAVEQRISYFQEKIEEYLIEEYLDDENYNPIEFNKCHKAWEFWKGMRENHCEPISRFEAEYLRDNRDTASPKEEAEWTKLEKKIGTETINCKDAVTPEMRWWFIDKFGYAADDCSVLKKWEERND